MVDWGVASWEHGCPWGVLPITMTGVLIGNFRKHPLKVPNSHFVDVASNSFTPLSGSKFQFWNNNKKIIANGVTPVMPLAINIFISELVRFEVNNLEIKIICVTNKVMVFVIFSDQWPKRPLKVLRQL